MTTEFITTLRLSDGSYTLASTWESTEQCNLTTALVFSHSGITGTIGNGSAVTQKVSGATGTCTHVTATQILIHTITGTFNGTDQIYETIDTNYVVPSDAGDDPISVLECYDDWAGGLSDSFVVSGSTTDATNYYVMRPASGEVTTGIPQSGFYFKKSFDYSTMCVVADGVYTILQNIDVENTASNGRCFDLGTTGLGDGCIGKGGTATNNAVFFNVRDRGYQNCLAYGGYVGFSGESWVSGGLVENCDAVNLTRGFHAPTSGGGSALVVKNSCAYGCTTSYNDGGTGWGASTNNAASDGSTTTPPGSNPITTDIVSGDFNNAAGDDYHLSGTGSTLYHAGINIGLTYDVDGDLWNNPPSIGFSELIAGGPIEATFTQTQGNSITRVADISVESSFNQTQSNSIARTAAVLKDDSFSSTLGNNIARTTTGIYEPSFPQGLGQNIERTSTYIGEPSFTQGTGFSIERLGGLIFEASRTLDVSGSISETADISMEGELSFPISTSISSSALGVYEPVFLQGIGNNISSISAKIVTDGFTATCGIVIDPTATVEISAIAGEISIGAGASISSITDVDFAANITIAEANEIANSVISTVESAVSETLGNAIAQIFDSDAVITPSTRQVIITKRNDTIGIIYEIRTTGILNQDRTINII